MQQLSGAVDTIVGKARKLMGRSAASDTQRQVFIEEFGEAPPYHEATASERELFTREVVRPVLTERAQAVHDAGQQAGSEAGLAFARAYRVATDMGLVDKGHTYRNYLVHQG